MCIDLIRRSYQYRNVQQVQQFSNHKSGLFSFQRIPQYCIQIPNPRPSDSTALLLVTAGVFFPPVIEVILVNHVLCFKKVIFLLPHFHKKKIALSSMLKKGVLIVHVSNIGEGKSIFNMCIPMCAWLLRANVTLNSEEQQHSLRKARPA